MDIKDLVEEAGYTPKRKAGCHGGEYSSPCPFCKDGDDRFLIWPNRVNKNGVHQGGRFSCRVCGKYGDAITFLSDLYDMNYLHVCEKLKLKPKENRPITVGWQLHKSIKVAINPPTLWSEKAKAFIEWCHLKLMSNSSILEKVYERGFTIESIIKYKIGFNPGDIQGGDFRRNRSDWGLEDVIKADGTLNKLWLPKGITIPTFSADQLIVKIKIRRMPWKEGDRLPKYVEVSGSKQSPSVYGDTTLALGLVIESELDALLIQQEAADLVFCVALGGSTKPIDTCTDDLLRRTNKVLFLPDFDEAGALAWLKWKKRFPQINRVLTPKGKSAGDAFLQGVNLRELIENHGQHKD